MKVKGTKLFNQYRNASLKLEKKSFNDLQAGKIADIPKHKVEEYPDLYEIVEKQPRDEVNKDGDK